MKAIACQNYKHPLKIIDIPKPSPKENEILIKVYASTVTTADWRLRTLTMPSGFGVLARLIFGFKKPRQPILGTELSGVVEAIGRNITRFKVGDAVVAMTGAALGCHVEYKCIAENKAVELKPDTLSYEQAAALSFGSITAFHFLKNKAKIQAGEKILIYGASGSVGSAAVQLARYLGAEVTGVCSLAHQKFVKSLGAHDTIDYAQEDFTRNAQKYHVILDCVGTLSFAQCKNSLATNGRLLLITAGLKEMLLSPFISLMNSQKIFAGPAPDNANVFRNVLTLAKEGYLKPVIDRVYTVEEIEQAYQHVSKRHKKGNVVITF